MEAATLETEKCVHHWKIESPNGSKALRGVCKKCGEENEEFKPFIEVWDSDLRKSEFNQFPLR